MFAYFFLTRMTGGRGNSPAPRNYTIFRSVSPSSAQKAQIIPDSRKTRPHIQESRRAAEVGSGEPPPAAIRGGNAESAHPFCLSTPGLGEGMESQELAGSDDVFDVATITTEVPCPWSPADSKLLCSAFQPADAFRKKLHSMEKGLF